MTVTTTLEDGVLVVALDDGKMNAVSHALVDGLHAALDTATSDAGAICIVGNAKALSAGFDLWVTDPYLLEDHFKLIGALVLATVGPTTIASVLAAGQAAPVAHEQESRAKVTA